MSVLTLVLAVCLIWVLISFPLWLIFELYDIVPRWVASTLTFPIWFASFIVEKIHELLTKIEKKRFFKKNEWLDSENIIGKSWAASLSEMERQIESQEETRRHFRLRPNLYETIEEFKRAIYLGVELDPISYHETFGRLRGVKYMFSDTLRHYYYLNDRVVLLELKNTNGFISKNITVCDDDDLIFYNANNFVEELNDIINKFNQGDVIDAFPWEKNDLLNDLMAKIKNENGGEKMKNNKKEIVVFVSEGELKEIEFDIKGNKYDGFVIEFLNVEIKVQEPLWLFSHSKDDEFIASSGGNTHITGFSPSKTKGVKDDNIL